MIAFYANSVRDESETATFEGHDLEASSWRPVAAEGNAVSLATRSRRPRQWARLPSATSVSKKRSSSAPCRRAFRLVRSGFNDRESHGGGDPRSGSSFGPNTAHCVP